MGQDIKYDLTKKTPSGQNHNNYNHNGIQRASFMATSLNEANNNSMLLDSYNQSMF